MRQRQMLPDVEYLCETCGEQIVIPVDVSAGRRQQYVEDCPVCCRPNVISLEIDEAGHVVVQSAAESRDESL